MSAEPEVGETVLSVECEYGGLQTVNGKRRAVNGEQNASIESANSQFNNFS